MVLLSPAGIGVKTNGRSAWLDAPAAASYHRMRAAGMPPGGITDAGRTNPEQWDMWRKYKAGKLKATAAYPGTSKHETGRALDLSGTALEWVRAHGAAYGWLSDRVKGERWHVEYHPAYDQHATPTTPPATAPAPTPQEDDMRHLWHYTSADPDLFIITDDLTMTYRIIPPGSLQEAAIKNDLAAGVRRCDVIADPAWGDTFGNGQYRRIDAPEPPAGGTATIDYAALARAVNDDAARRLAQ